ncbi:MAG TPA: CPBP family intramembrane glutamic endopeptidase [Sphingomicrobium sp.]|jgi:membrane protease YdiL (CAAX protease family)|nr:CPBP family intramembrane glutamic endopeptidase [Sphingomicrobium sp.]
MIDLLLTIALHVAIVTLFALGLKFGTKERVDLRPFFIGIGLLIVYWGVIVAGSEVQGLLPFAANLKWNWAGKIVAICATFAMIFAVRRGSLAEFGLTLRQRPGSLVPALLVIAAMCALSWGAEAWANDGTDTSVERLLFQATMPGLDEELFTRGLLLAMFMRAFDDRWSLAGAPVGPSIVAITFLFAAGHGLAFVGGQLHFDGLAFALTAALGFGLAWLRLRTGSLIAPIVGHNLINLGNSFF